MSATDNDMEVDVSEIGDVAVLVPRITYFNYVCSEDVKTMLKQTCSVRIAGGARAIVLDLSNVGIIDSCGLSLLISVKKGVDAHNVRFALCGVSPVIQRLFEITKLDQAFAIFPDQATAARGAN